MIQILKQRNQWSKSKLLKSRIFEKYKIIGRKYCLEYYKISNTILDQIIIENCKPTNKLHLGYKLDSYHTEDEMINGFNCTYEQLSDNEKLIYDNL